LCRLFQIAFAIPHHLLPEGASTTRVEQEHLDETTQTDTNGQALTLSLSPEPWRRSVEITNGLNGDGKPLPIPRASVRFVFHWFDRSRAE
jgi:hypothetical protein